MLKIYLVIMRLTDKFKKNNNGPYEHRHFIASRKRILFHSSMFFPVMIR